MMEFENKRYFSKGELSGDKDCSLNPPWIISGTGLVVCAV